MFEQINFENKNYVDGLVSVIIPTRNRANLIIETLDSAANQSYSNIEVLIVDDNSTDNTESVINTYIDGHPTLNIYYIKSDKTGACAARNIGLKKAKGEFIQFFDSDDILGKEQFATEVNILLTHKEYDFVCCNYYYFENTINNIVRTKRIDNIEHTVESHMKNSAFPTPSYFFRRQSISKIGLWDESCLRLQDIRYFNRIFLVGLNGYWLNKYLFFVRIHNNNITNTFNNINVCKSLFNTYEFIFREWGNKASKKLKYFLIRKELSIVYLAIRHTFLYFAFRKATFIIFIHFSEVVNIIRNKIKS